MGCWNKTCGLSGLHILAGTPVYVFILEQVPVYEQTYTTGMFTPLLLPFEAEYNDYGGIENCTGFVDMVVNGVRNRLVEMEQGENEFHDIPVHRDNFSVEKMIDAALEGRLFVKHYRGESHRVDFVLFRKDIVDDILDNHVIEQYVGKETGNYGHDNCYIQYKFEDIVSEIPEYLGPIVKHYHEQQNSVIKRPYMFDYDRKSKVERYVHDNSYRYSSLVSVNKEVNILVESGDIEQATKLLAVYLKGTFIDSFMNQVRKLWIPGGHEGSQNQEHSGYRMLISSMKKALDKEQREQEGVG